jgi:hypothetical protein
MNSSGARPSKPDPPLSCNQSANCVPMPPINTFPAKSIPWNDLLNHNDTVEPIPCVVAGRKSGRSLLLCAVRSREFLFLVSCGPVTRGSGYAEQHEACPSGETTPEFRPAPYGKKMHTSPNSIACRTTRQVSRTVRRKSEWRSGFRPSSVVPRYSVIAFRFSQRFSSETKGSFSVEAISRRTRRIVSI